MNALTKIENTALSTMAEAELLDVLQSSLYPGASLPSIKMVLGYCKAAGLDPMQKPVHIVPMSVKKPGTRDQYEWRDVIMPGVGLYRTQAARTGQLSGISEPEFGPDQVLTIGQFTMTYPEWCRVTVSRILPNGHEAQFTAKEYWLENYATAGKDTTAPNTMWKRRTRGQIAKCAQAQALRMAFPEMTGSQPTADEMEGRPLEEDARPPVTATVEDVRSRASYPADQFDKNLPAWRDVIAKGRKTADQIIAMAETKFPLTDEQKAAVRATDAKPAEKVTDAGPVVTFATVAEAIVKAGDDDKLAEAEDLIGAVADAEQRAELVAKAKARRAELHPE